MLHDLDAPVLDWPWDCGSWKASQNTEERQLVGRLGDFLQHMQKALASPSFSAPSESKHCPAARFYE